MAKRRFVPPTLTYRLHLISQDGARHIHGFVQWFNGNSSVQLSEPDYWGPGREDHHVYNLRDGRRRYPNRYGNYQIVEEDLPGLRALRFQSVEMNDDQFSVFISQKVMRALEHIIIS